MRLCVKELSGRERAAFQPMVRALEDGVTYPLGEDRFEINHGQDYFAFFERLGELSYFVVLHGQRIVAVAAGILREVPKVPGEEPRTVWYGCDLKVKPEYRGRRIPWRLLHYAFPQKYLVCRRLYWISMNPANGRENPVVDLFSRFRLRPMSVGAILYLYSLDAETMLATSAMLEDFRGPLSYLSLRGKKDIVLSSTAEPMPLLHVQFGPCAEAGLSEPQEQHVHMFCMPSDDALVEALAKRGVTPSATASVVQHGMSGWDWRFVLTSDI